MILKLNGNKFFVAWVTISLFGITGTFIKAENKAKKWPSHIQVVLDSTKPLEYDRGGRLPLYLWQAMDPGQLNEEDLEELITELDKRGVGLISSWNPSDRQESLAQSLMIAKIQEKLNLCVNINANRCLYSFFNGDERTAHTDDEGKPFWDDSFGKKKMGCPFALDFRQPYIREQVEYFAKAFKDVDLDVDFVFADWEIKLGIVLSIPLLDRTFSGGIIDLSQGPTQEEIDAQLFAYEASLTVLLPTVVSILKIHYIRFYLGWRAYIEVRDWRDLNGNGIVDIADQYSSPYWIQITGFGAYDDDIYDRTAWVETYVTIINAADAAGTAIGCAWNIGIRSNREGPYGTIPTAGEVTGLVPLDFDDDPYNRHIHYRRQLLWPWRPFIKPMRMSTNLIDRLKDALENAKDN